MSKERLTAQDVEDAVALLLKPKNPNPDTDYYVFLMGVRLVLADQYCSVSIVAPMGGRLEGLELQGTPALDWITAACREKAEREQNDDHSCRAIQRGEA